MNAGKVGVSEDMKSHVKYLCIIFIKSQTYAFSHFVTEFVTNQSIIIFSQNHTLY